MRRYWIFMALAPLLAAGFGSYYVQVAAGEWPQYVLQQVSGDAQVAAGLELQGTYSRGQLREPVLISKDGSDYIRDSPLVSRLSRAIAWNPDWEALIQQYRGFMRGKSPNPMQIYQDDQQLVYVAVNKASGGEKSGYRLHISELDKKSGQTNDVQAALPGGEAYTTVYVRGIRVMDGQCKIITQNVSKEVPDGEVHLYTIAADGRGQVRDQPLTSGPAAGPDVKVSTQITDVRGPSPYVALLSGQMLYLPNQGGRTLVGQYINVYDLRTGEEVKIESNLVNDVLGTKDASKRLSVFTVGNSVYLVSQDNQTIRVVDYDIVAKKTVDRVISTSLQHPLVQIKHGFLYAIEVGKVEIRKTTTGELLYEGSIGLKDANGQTDNPLGHLMLYGMLLD